MSSLKTVVQLLVAALLAGACLTANAAERQCPPEPVPLAEDELRQLAAQARDRGFLWKLSKNGHDSWLYGTLHVGKPEWAMPGPKVIAALRNSAVVALELDVGDPATQKTLQDIYVRGAGRFPDALKARLEAQLDRVCLPASMLADMNPLLLLTTVELLRGREIGLEAGYGSEFILSGFAHAAGKGIVSLETPEGQMSSLVPPDGLVDVAELTEALHQLETSDTPAILNRIAAVWSTSDLAQLNQYEAWCNCMETPMQRADMKELLDDRNGPLAQAIDVLHMQGKPVFAAVGSLHMVGSNGLPALLAGRGYTVSRIEFE